jgi:hypothetical protein
MWMTSLAWLTAVCSVRNSALPVWRMRRFSTCGLCDASREDWTAFSGIGADLSIEGKDLNVRIGAAFAHWAGFRFQNLWQS